MGEGRGYLFSQQPFFCHFDYQSYTCIIEHLNIIETDRTQKVKSPSNLSLPEMTTAELVEFFSRFFRKWILFYVTHFTKEAGSLPALFAICSFGWRSTLCPAHSVGGSWAALITNYMLVAHFWCTLSRTLGTLGSPHRGGLAAALRGGWRGSSGPSKGQIGLYLILCLCPFKPLRPSPHLSPPCILLPLLPSPPWLVSLGAQREARRPDTSRSNQNCFETFPTLCPRTLTSLCGLISPTRT